MSGKITEELRLMAKLVRDYDYKEISRMLREAAETIQRQQERIAELERSLEYYRLEVICYESDVDRLNGLICDLWECLSAHIESAINDGGIGYDYKPQVRGCGESCTVNGEDCSMALMEQRIRELGIEVEQ